MTQNSHYLMAEEILRGLNQLPPKEHEVRSEWIAEAQVHATLAVAASCPSPEFRDEVARGVASDA
jgi:hypothetical protein